MFERRLFFHIDWLLLTAVVALCAMGVVMIYSTTHTYSPELYRKQMYAIVIGLVGLVACLSIDYRSLADKSHLIYLAVVGLLLYTLIGGQAQGGARRWIALKFFNMQPSELAKIALALVLAKYFGELRRATVGLGDAILAGMLTLVPLVLIVREPDLGSAIALIPILAGIVVLAGFRMKIVVVVAVLALAAAPVAWRFGLKDYQKSRIQTFIDPSMDPRGAGYQQIQAQITVGSGGFWGKGFLKGTQGQLRFLPVAYNDFIFSAFAEEHGFLGVLVALALYLTVILRSLESARLAKDRLGAYLVMGLIAVFTFQVIYNVTMSAGLAPVKGLTLPLMSYGGSSILATLMSFGLILNVRMRRFTN